MRTIESVAKFFRHKIVVLLCIASCCSAGNFDDFDFSTTSVDTSSAPTTAPLQTTDLNFADFDFGGEEVTSPSPTEPTKPVEFGIPMDIPYIGTISLIPFTDELTQKAGYKAKFADATKKVQIGDLVIDDGTISLIDNKLGITGRATLFDKQAQFGLKEIAMGEKRSLQRAVLGVTFAQKPTIELLPGKSITLDTTDIIIEKGKPLQLMALTTLFGKQLVVGFSFTKQSVGAFLNLPPNTPLNQIIPGVNGTPLEKGIITQAKLTIHNLVSKKSAKDSKNDDALSASLSGIVNLASTNLSENAAALDHLTIAAHITNKGITASINANSFPIQNIGTINTALISIDTVAKPNTIILSGNLAFTVPNVGPLTINVHSAITSKGIEFSGSVPQEFNYAGFSLKNFKASYDTTQKVAELVGNIVVEGLSLLATIKLLPDAQDSTKRTLSFTGRGEAKTFEPFKNSGIPLINTFKLTDFDSTITLEQKKGKTVSSLTLNGDMHMLGKSLKSMVRFVSNDKGEKGIYMNAPLSKDQTLSDFFPALKGPIFDGIHFKEASFSASSIDFFDDQNKVLVKKGLSFLAAVPLEGSLAQVGKLMGAANQTFTMYGSIVPENVLLSEFGILLSKGTVDPNAKFSLGEMAVAITGAPSLNVLANLFFRPNPQEMFEFTGKFAFSETTANLSASMDGSWKNAFGLSGWELTNPSLLLGILYGSPGIPTEIGGTAELIARTKNYNPQDPPFLDMAIAFIADAALKNMAFEGKANRSVSYLQAAQFVIDYFLAAAFNTSIPNFAKMVPDIAFYDLYARYATRDTKIGSKIIKQGIAAAGKTDLLGSTAEVNFNLDFGGLKAYGGLEPVNIQNVLKIYGRGEKQKPEIDIELTLARQLFRVTGILELVSLYKTETFVELSSNGFEFNFESALGGNNFMWDGKPLLLSKVHGVSSGSFSNPNFTIEILFQQYLKKFILDQIDKGFTAAKEAVERDLKAARTEIDKIDSVIKKADDDIKNARDIVARAQRDLDAITQAKTKARSDLESAQRAVDSLKSEEDKLDRWFSSLPKV